MKQKRDDRIIIAVMNHSKRCFGAVNHLVVIPWTTQTWDAAGTDPVISKGIQPRGLASGHLYQEDSTIKKSGDLTLLPEKEKTQG